MEILSSNGKWCAKKPLLFHLTQDFTKENVIVGGCIL
jgi:hypothetical protein